MHSSRAQVMAFGMVSTRDGAGNVAAAGAGVTAPAYDPGMNGRIALVTGAGSGLGAAISRRLAADGAHLIVNDLDADAAAKVAADIGGEAAPFDVTDSASFTAAVDDAVARHGRIDVLVNNAGHRPRPARGTSSGHGEHGRPHGGSPGRADRRDARRSPTSSGTA